MPGPVCVRVCVCVSLILPALLLGPVLSEMPLPLHMHDNNLHSTIRAMVGEAKGGMCAGARQGTSRDDRGTTHELGRFLGAIHLHHIHVVCL
jgi:hypothetical protein